MSLKGMSTLTVSALSCISECSFCLQLQPLYWAFHDCGSSLEIWMYDKITQSSIRPWDGWPGLAAAIRAGRLGWQNLHAWLITAILRHMAGPVALAMQKYFVVTAVRADIEEGSLYFICSKAGFNFSCDRPAALACSFMSNSSGQAWVSSRKQK